MKSTFFLFLTLLITLNAQTTNLFIPLDVQEAYLNGTRNYDGSVAKNYWINHTDYKIDVELIPQENLITGSATITYYNESPDTLSLIVLRLYQNITKPGAIRDWILPESVLNDGIKLNTLECNGNNIDIKSQNINIYGTNMFIHLKDKLLPKSKIELKITWEFNFAKRALRMGNYKGDFFVAYWYPQVSVYDDVYGWDVIQYSGTAEFYNDFNNYDINYTVPDDYVVWSTGDLQNCKTLFHENIVQKINEAKNSDDIIHIITLDNYKNNNVTIKNNTGKNIWHYIAKKVPDVAWAASNNYNWDAGSVEVEPGRRVLTSAIYPDSVVQNKNAALYAQKSIKYLSFVSPGVPYPWSHTTAFTNKGRGGGMEFPMMQNNGAPKGISSSLGLIFHEISHNYFPFYMGTNERQAAWMDEGWASFFPRRTIEECDSISNYQAHRVLSYERVAGKIKDMPMILPSYMMTHGESRNNYYNRPEVAYEELRHLLGDELFHKALREYMNRWHEKHPIAYDFFFTFNDVTGKDLSWFWKPWFFELGYPDLAIENVTVSDNNAKIEIKKLGNIPTRIELTITYDDDSKEIIKHSASVWENNSDFVVEHPISKKIKSVLLGSKLIPDANRRNNLYKN